VGTAGQVPFLEANVAEHALHESYVLGLTAMRRAGHRELLVAPPERVEPSRAEKRDDLKGLGTGSPVRERFSIPSSADELIAIPHHRGVYSVFRFNPFPAGNCDI
jgi:hypothetical protein